MAGRTTIEWTGVTWNPTRGCSVISPGCAHCYAQRQAGRFCGAGQPFDGFVKKTVKSGYRWTGKVSLVESMLDWPKKVRKPQLIFVNSMSDLFHEALSLEEIQRVFEVMAACPQHTFQVLTKRSARLAEFAPRLSWPENLWMGVSVESQAQVHRVDDLRSVGAAVRFLSIEPMLGHVDVQLGGIGWVICGGESGPGARPMDLDWARSLRDQCLDSNVPFFLKQLGGTTHKRGGDEAVLDGRTWREMPVR